MLKKLGVILSFAAVVLTSFSAFAETNEPETYSRLRFTLGGYVYSGNVNQIQGNLQGHYGLSSPTLGVDVLFNGYSLWSKTDEKADYEIKGDDLFVTAVPFWYFTERLYVAGLARYESSKSVRLNSRYLGGAGLGYTPVRTKDFLVRCSVMPAYEMTTFDGDEFRIDVSHDGPERSVFRLAVMSNGWYRVKGTPVTLRYFAQAFPNPEEVDDLRLNVTGNIDLKLNEQLAFRTTLLVNHDAAILDGREPTDIRSTFGFTWASK